MRKPKFVYIYKDFDVNLRSCLQSVGASQDAAVIIILTNGRVVKRGIEVEWTTFRGGAAPKYAEWPHAWPKADDSCDTG